MTKPKKKDLKTTVEEGIRDVLASTSEPSDGRLKALALGIKMCALNAKLEESEYGDFFNSGETNDTGTRDAGSIPPRPKHPARRRAAGDEPVIE